MGLTRTGAVRVARRRDPTSRSGRSHNGEQEQRDGRTRRAARRVPAVAEPTADCLRLRCCRGSAESASAVRREDWTQNVAPEGGLHPKSRHPTRRLISASEPELGAGPDGDSVRLEEQQSFNAESLVLPFDLNKRAEH